MGELGNTLSRARRARGVTIEDAERDTHVSKRYLQALEVEDFSIFPAPVYARGFLRTYSRYLGLNPEELIRVFPNGDLAVDITPLPTVTRPPGQLINVNWVVAGLVAIFLLGAALLLLRAGDNSAIVDTRRSDTPATAPPGAGLNSQPPAGPALLPGTTPGKPIGPVKPGQIPDFVNADVGSAMAVLRDNQMNYVIVEIANKTTPKGIVISQTPAAGAKTDSGSAITLYVSGGPGQ